MNASALASMFVLVQQHFRELHHPFSPQGQRFSCGASCSFERSV